MLSAPLHELIPVLQVAIGPVILISGIGLLLLTLTNRLGRTIDRSRQLAHEMNPAHPQAAPQVGILYRRANLLRLSIITAAASVLFVSVLIITLFLTVLMKWEAGLLIVLFFIIAMLLLIVSLIAFIKDIQLSLVALKLELRAHTPLTESPDRTSRQHRQFS